MATNTLTGGIRPVTLPNQFPPMPAVARILARFTREELHGFIAVAIDLADTMDGDADLEATEAEDDFAPRLARRCDGPGCNIADPDYGADDEGEETDAEDCFLLSKPAVLASSGPGCSIADPGEIEDGL